MAEPGNIKTKSMEEMDAQIGRIYNALGGYSGLQNPENNARYQRAIKAYERYTKNINRSSQMKNYTKKAEAFNRQMGLSPRESVKAIEQGADYVQVPRSVYMRNNRR